MGLAVPDTAIAIASRDFVREVSGDTLYNHCERTYGFGAPLGRRQGWDFDQETFYVACLMHDLGLVERFDGPDDFERQGGKAAHEFLIGKGWDEAKADLVREAISVHMQTGTEDHERKEIPMVRLGAAADCLGWGIEDLAPELVQELTSRYPRAGLKAELVRLMGDQISRKPDSWLALIEANLGWLQRLEDAPFDE